MLSLTFQRKALKMKVLVTGGTGFVGRPLVSKLVQSGHDVVVLSRNVEKAKASFSEPVSVFPWNAETGTPPIEAYQGVEAIIHLAGESIAAGRWTQAQKKKILDSRVLSTQNLLKGAIEAKAKLKAVVTASAIGIYGDRGNDALSETSPQGIGFLADVCRAWEKASNYPGLESVRKVNLRIGIVLEKNGGALQKLLPIFKLGGGGPVGNGKQWMSWIHREDLVEMIVFALTHDNVQGVYNAVTPNPSTNAQFSKALGQALSRPAFLPAPGFALKLAMGEMSDLVLASQKVEAKKIQEAGFKFKFANIQEALNDICKKKTS